MVEKLRPEGACASSRAVVTAMGNTSIRTTARNRFEAGGLYCIATPGRRMLPRPTTSTGCPAPRCELADGSQQERSNRKYAGSDPGIGLRTAAGQRDVI